MQKELDLSGDWSGSYEQGDSLRPIEARLVQDGSRLTGTMRDGVTEFRKSLFESACEAGLPPGADEKMERKLRELHPNLPPGPIRFVSRIPPESILEGKILDRTVRLVKTYQGKHLHGYLAVDALINATSSEVSVDYEGQVSPDGNEIEGFWSIQATSGGITAEGYFVLTRKT